MLGCMQSMNQAGGVERRPRRTRSEWACEVAQWRGSGRSAAEYARERGLKHGTLLWWSTQLKREPKQEAAERADAPAVAFLPLRVRSPRPAASASEAACVEVILGNGRRVRVVGEVDVAQLARVLAAAEGGERC